MTTRSLHDTARALDLDPAVLRSELRRFRPILDTLGTDYDDLLQDVALRLVANPPRVRDGAYLRRAIRHCIIATFRQTLGRRDSAFKAERLAILTAAPDERTIRMVAPPRRRDPILRRTVDRALAALPPLQRKAVIRTVRGDERGVDLARALGKSRASISDARTHGLRKLRGALSHVA